MIDCYPLYNQETIIRFK